MGSRGGGWKLLACHTSPEFRDATPNDRIKLGGWHVRGWGASLKAHGLHLAAVAFPLHFWCTVRCCLLSRCTFWYQCIGTILSWAMITYSHVQVRTVPSYTLVYTALHCSGHKQNVAVHHPEGTTNLCRLMHGGSAIIQQCKCSSVISASSLGS